MNTSWKGRLRDALVAAAIHLLLSLIISAAAAALVWGLWYPHPYDKLSGGTGLFLLIVGVDVICGPVLTSVVFDRRKPVNELRRDISLIAIIQMLALGYGLHTVFEARPLYLVHEVDRFRVVTYADYLGVDVSAQLDALPAELRLRVLSGPVLVGVRATRDVRERSTVLLDAMQGGRDFAQRPDFYVPYDEAYAPTVLRHAVPATRLLAAMPNQAEGMTQALTDAGVDIANVWTVPMVHRENWIALIDPEARILGFVPGDGFAVR